MNKTLAWIALGIGGLFVLWKYAQATGSPLASDLDPFFGGLFPQTAPTMRNPSAQYAAVSPYMPTKQAGNAPSYPHTSSSLPTGAISTAGAAGIAGAVGLGSAAAVATAGIAAGVGLLVWGIADKGWFRGGEEGVKVNPARDNYLSQFAKYDYMRDDRNPPGFYGLSLVLTHLGQHDLFDQLAKADTMQQFNAVVSAINQAMAFATPDQYNGVVSELAAYRSGAVAA